MYDFEFKSGYGEIFLEISLGKTNKLKYKINPNFKFNKVLLYDTVNNPFFPFSKIVNDTYKFEFPEYKRYIQTFIYGRVLDEMPFHFFIEFVETEYTIISTRSISRPADLSKVTLDIDILEKYGDIFLNSIHIVVLGDYSSQVSDIFLRRKILNLVETLYVISLKMGSNINKAQFFYQLNLPKEKFIPEHEFKNNIIEIKTG